MNEQPTPTSEPAQRGSLDGAGSSDHDEPFVGHHAYHFSARQLARLLQLRSEVLEARMGCGRWSQDVLATC